MRVIIIKSENRHYNIYELQKDVKVLCRRGELNLIKSFKQDELSEAIEFANAIKGVDTVCLDFDFPLNKGGRNGKK